MPGTGIQAILARKTRSSPRFPMISGMFAAVQPRKRQRQASFEPFKPTRGFLKGFERPFGTLRAALTPSQSLSACRTAVEQASSVCGGSRRRPPPQAQHTVEASKAPKLKSSKAPQEDFQPMDHERGYGLSMMYMCRCIFVRVQHAKTYYKYE